MRGFVKNILRSTPLFGIVRNSRIRKSATQWTEHDEAMANFYSQFLSAGDLSFDVGANIGNRTKIFLHLGARVVAVEPQTECTRVLISTFGKNTHFTLVQKVLGSSDGEAELMIGNPSALSSLSPEWITAVT